MNNYRVLPTGFIEVDVTSDMIEKTESRNETFFKRLGNTGTHRIGHTRQRVTGYLAEMAVKEIYPKLEFSQDPNIDFVFGKITFDVKAQGCNSEPMSNYVGTLYEEQASRAVDLYVFTRVRNDSKKVWVTGLISKPHFFDLAKLVPAGKVNNNFKYDQSRYEIEYNKLIKPGKFLGKI
jgi:hypothetical protein